MSASGRLRRATNLHLEARLVAEARRLGVNLSRGAEDGRGREDNREALVSCNARVAEHGLPLAKYRMFRMAGFDVHRPGRAGPAARRSAGPAEPGLRAARGRGGEGCRIRAALDMLFLGF
jgi:antitoxin CcdA